MYSMRELKRADADEKRREVNRIVRDHPYSVLSTSAQYVSKKMTVELREARKMIFKGC